MDIKIRQLKRSNVAENADFSAELIYIFPDKMIGVNQLTKAMGIPYTRAKPAKKAG